jgi:hypothetical protein
MCILLCVLLPACGPENSLLVGPDTSLYVSDTVDRAELQERFFGLMCRRAGLAVPGSPQDRPVCNVSSMTFADWRRVVLAALNDIDDRCEMYLSSLDKAKKDRAAYLQQLRNTTSTVSLILTASGMDVGSKALAVVHAAFGLAENSLDNYYSRLILEVEGGTIQQLVLKRQTAFRVLLKENYLHLVENKPTAFHVVRSYLRICQPVSIEGAITSTIDDLVYLPPDQTNGYKYYARTGPRRGTSRVETRDDPDLEALRVYKR